tara:strand:- start:487 stop:855 length:369 start_codon:yes stop_codon:yes gene_type:complete
MVKKIFVLMKRLLMPLIATLALPACTTEVVYETRELAWNECRSWMKEGGEFYIHEGSGYEMVTRWLPRRFCLHDEDKMEMVGQELIQIKKGEKFLAENFPEIGKGIAITVTKKTYKYQKPIR